jgi:hypothetical protein
MQVHLLDIQLNYNCTGANLFSAIKAIVMPLVVKQPKLKTFATLHTAKPSGHFPSL